MVCYFLSRSFCFFSFHIVLFFMAVIYVLHPLSLLTFDSGLDYWFNFQSKLNGSKAFAYIVKVVQPIQKFSPIYPHIPKEHHYLSDGVL